MSRRSAVPDSSTPAVKGPGRPRVSVDERLLKAMERLLTQGQNFSTLTVEQLAAEAGIARATFYLRFRDKSALVASLLACISDEIVTSSGGWFGDAKEVEPGLIFTAMRGIVYAFKRHQAVLRAVAETIPFDQTVAHLHVQMLNRLRAESRTAVARVRQQGHAHPMADDLLADLLTDMIELYCSRSLQQFDGTALDAIADRLARIGANAIFSAEALSGGAVVPKPAKALVKKPDRKARESRKAGFRPE